MFTILLKKEIKEIFFNYKTWLAFLFVSATPIIFKHFQVSYDGWYLLLLTSLTIGQFVFDSFSDDVYRGGCIFVYNLNTDFYIIFAAKLLVAFFIGALQYASTFYAIVNIFNKSDVLWLLLLSIFSSLLMFIACVLTSGSEFFSFLIETIFIVPLVILFSKLNSTRISLVIVLFLIAVAFYICKKLWNSKLFRFSL